MASKQDIEAGKAFVRLYAKDELSKGLRSVGESLQGLGSSIKTIGATVTAASSAVVAFGLAAAKSFSDTGDAVEKMASRTGLSTEAVSELGHAADLSGTNIQTLESGIKKLQQTLVEASSGSKTAAKAINDLGLSATDLLNLRPDEQFSRVADAISQITDPAERTAKAISVFGKAGTQLLPMLQAGSRGIADMRRQARELGLSIDREAASGAARLNDALGALHATLDGLWRNIGAAIAPAVSMLAERMAKAAGAVSLWIKANPGLITGIAAAAVAIATFGSVVTTVGAAIEGLGFIFSAVGLVLKGVFAPELLAVAAVMTVVAGLAYGLIQSTIGFDGLAAAAGRALEILRTFGQIVSTQGIAGLAEILQRGTAVVKEFWSDILDNLPGHVMFIMGKVARVMFDQWWNIMTTIGKVVMKAMSGIGEMMKGNLSGGWKEFTASLHHIGDIGQGFQAGFFGGENPWLKLDRTKAAMAGLTAPVPVGTTQPQFAGMPSIHGPLPSGMTQAFAARPFTAAMMPHPVAGQGMPQGPINPSTWLNAQQLMQQMVEEQKKTNLGLAELRFKYNR